MTDNPAERGPNDPSTRREFLAGAGGVTVGTGLAAILAERNLAHPVQTTALGDSPRTAAGDRPADVVFPQSVASGDPSSTGVILWTRIDPDVHSTERAPLQVTVATDEDFETVVHRGTIEATHIGPENDWTVSVDLDEHLESGREYFYRFSYDGTHSQVGRCQTVPAPEDDPERVRIVVVTCQDYTNGYYPAYRYIADADVDFLLHLGDFIYEAVDGRFKGPGSRSYEGRAISLPGGEPVAQDLADFRTLHRVYRSDRFLQAALEQHTLIPGWDDHEIANNRYWDYESGVPTAPGRAGDLTQLTADGIEAWVEYMPTRVGYDPETPATPDLHEAFDLGRTFQFGNLVEVVLTDERLFRSQQPCGERTAAGPTCQEAEAPDSPDNRNTMLGTQQRQWFLDAVTDSTATWTVWANEVLTMPFEMGEHGKAYHPPGHDAWDGYQWERTQVMNAIQEAKAAPTGLENFITLTGDLHTALAGYQQVEYDDPTADPSTSPLAPEGNRVGVEFMTPAVTSVNGAELHPGPSPPGEPTVLETLAYANNRHIQYLNSSRWGYSIVEFTDEDCTYTAYAVDKTEDSRDANRDRLVVLRVPEGEVRIEEQGGVDTTVDAQHPR